MYEGTAKHLISDTELITRFNAGDSISFTALFKRYLPLVHKMQRQYYFKQYDREDWEQEARIVCLKVIRQFDENNGATFGSFFKISLRNRAFDIIRREKRIEYVNETITSDEENEVLVDYSRSQPDECAICHTQIDEFLTYCSPFELNVFDLIVKGRTRSEIKILLKCDQRSIDGALSRCRKKLKLAMK
ncbi:sigma-70 family RNA polymerase sigma factor [Paucilactobacillus nenjiangensis]|jgi:RNA polymerase sporulation-specific sigma factor|uniref:sigma-70 family RNA polymerase sigma factor n=1 Tax=Paucilactobacillus nenjiangensis TaxID=1296540 RepID=UPI0010F66859|nr:sigma-70 family RNA polymerase sigma factor [Paucilactobacillus nenjiangensis]